MKIKETIGIDVSKATIDVNIYSTNNHQVFSNNTKGFASLCKWVYKTSSYPKEEILFIFEHTGLYSHNISQYFADKKVPFLIVSGLEIKRSMGLIRGKSDKSDARLISTYGIRMRNELKPYILPRKKIIVLKKMLSLRRKLVQQRAGHKTTLKELRSVLGDSFCKILSTETQRLIKVYDKSIKNIEKEMNEIIEDDEKLKGQVALLLSIKGIGLQIALHTIVYTNEFKSFKTWRQFASYCGIAPFQHKSGTSIRGKTQVSQYANKVLKSLLEMGARAAIQHNKELRTYYKNRLLKKSNKTSALNIIRNKLVSRMFAVIRRNSPYVEIYNYM